MVSTILGRERVALSWADAIDNYSSRQGDEDTS
jgi:hypothetical protein